MNLMLHLVYKNTILQKAPKYKEHKKNILINAKHFYYEREMIVNAFKNGIFPLVPSDYTFDDDRDLRPDSSTFSFSTTDESDKSNELDFTADDLDKIYIDNVDGLDKLLLDTGKYLDPDLIEKYIFNKSLKKIFEFLKHKAGILYHKTKITLIKSRLRDLKNDIKNMSENEVKNKKNLIY